jgi:hypothetical protein
MKKYNISRPEKYFDKKAGNEKTAWTTVGTMTEFEKPDGSITRFIEIPAIGLKASVFEQRTESTQKSSLTPEEINTLKIAREASMRNVDIPTDDINPDLIPF